MIKSFKDKELECCWKTGRCKKIKRNLLRRVLMKLDSMDAAICIEDLNNPPSNNLHRLKGSYENYWAISVNGPWRLIFKLKDGDIYEIELVQYH